MMISGRSNSPANDNLYFKNHIHLAELSSCPLSLKVTKEMNFLTLFWERRKIGFACFYLHTQMKAKLKVNTQKRNREKLNVQVR